MMPHGNGSNERNEATLRAIYADLTTIEQYCDPGVVLHLANRRAGSTPVSGSAAVGEHERNLVGMTGGTLVMEVRHIFANDHFGASFGILHAGPPDHGIAMPFCGAWRFRDGLVVEHWENAYDPDTLGPFLLALTAPAQLSGGQP